MAQAPGVQARFKKKFAERKKKRTSGTTAPNATPDVPPTAKSSSSPVKPQANKGPVASKASKESLLGPSQANVGKVADRPSGIVGLDTQARQLEQNASPASIAASILPSGGVVKGAGKVAGAVKSGVKAAKVLKAGKKPLPTEELTNAIWHQERAKRANEALAKNAAKRAKAAHKVRTGTTGKLDDIPPDVIQVSINSKSKKLISRLTKAVAATTLLGGAAYGWMFAVQWGADDEREVLENYSFMLRRAEAEGNEEEYQARLADMNTYLEEKEKDDFLDGTPVAKLNQVWDAAAATRRNQETTQRLHDDRQAAAVNGQTDDEMYAERHQKNLANVQAIENVPVQSAILIGQIIAANQAAAAEAAIGVREEKQGDELAHEREKAAIKKTASDELTVSLKEGQKDRENQSLDALKEELAIQQEYWDEVNGGGHTAAARSQLFGGGLFR